MFFVPVSHLYQQCCMQLMFAIRERETRVKEGKKQDNSKKQLIDWQHDYGNCWALNNIDEFDFELQAGRS